VLFSVTLAVRKSIILLLLRLGIWKVDKTRY